MADLRNGGFSVLELRKESYNAAELKEGGFTVHELRVGGYGVHELLEDKLFNLGDLRAGGFTAETVRTAGFGVPDMRNGKYTLNELLAIDYSLLELKEGGYGVVVMRETTPNGVKKEWVRGLRVLEEEHAFDPAA